MGFISFQDACARDTRIRCKRAAKATMHHAASRMMKGMKAMIHDDQQASPAPATFIPM
jgi:hypothetical protein